MNKTRVAILRGGPSEEYAVSMNTGTAVLEALDRERFDAIDVVITRSGEWLIDGYTRFPENILSNVDVVFLALHGTYGEDGTVQRLLDRHGVKYTGSKAFPSSVAMHKVIAKDHLRDLEVQMLPHMLVTQSSTDSVHKLAESIGKMFGPSYVVKPVSSGSSVGTIMVENAAMLPQALKDSLEKYDAVIVEKRVTGREATCGVIDRFRGQDLYVLPPIEIVPPEHADFFDDTVKYDGTTEEICPGRFDRSTMDEIERVAQLVHQTLNLSQYSRSDFMIDEDGIYFLEVNTLPYLAQDSPFITALESVGSSRSAFIDHVLSEMT